MTQVSISEAARLAGVSRSTINRHLKEGKISKHHDNLGKPYVEVSELQRFYGSLSRSDSSAKDSTDQRGTFQVKATVLDLQRKLDAAENALVTEKAMRQRAEESEAKWQAQADRLTNLLADQRVQATPPKSDSALQARPARPLLSIFGLELHRRGS